MPKYIMSLPSSERVAITDTLDVALMSEGVDKYCLATYAYCRQMLLTLYLYRKATNVSRIDMAVFRAYIETDPTVICDEEFIETNYINTMDNVPFADKVNKYSNPIHLGQTRNITKLILFRACMALFEEYELHSTDQCLEEQQIARIINTSEYNGKMVYTITSTVS